MAQTLPPDRWARDFDDFACRIEYEDLSGLLSRTLVVEEGTRAIILQAGVCRGQVNAGSYTLAGALDRLLESLRLDNSSRTSVLLFDAGDAVLRVLFRKLRTQDALEADAALELVISLTDPLACLNNLMKSQVRVKNDQIEGILRGAISNVLQSVVRSVPARDLYGNVDLRERIKDELDRELRDTLSRNGLQLNQVRAFEAACAAYEEHLTKTGGQVAFKAVEVEAAAEWAALKARIRESKVADAVDKINNRKELEEFLRQARHDLQMKKILLDEELADLTRRVQEGADDKTQLRQRILQQIDIEHQLAMMRITYSGENEAVDHQLAIERKRFEDKQRKDWEAFEQDRRRRQAEYEDRLRATRDEEETRKTKMDRRIEELAKIKGVRGGEKDRDVDREQKVEQARHERELTGQRIKAELQLTELEAKKALSAEQLLALAAENSAAAADVLKAKFGAESQGEIKAMYEKMLEIQRQSGHQLSDAQQQMMKTMQEMFTKGLEAQRDTASAAARGSSPQVVYPPGGGLPQVMGVLGTAASAGTRMCISCGHQIPADNKFCSQCGEKQA